MNRTGRPSRYLMTTVMRLMTAVAALAVGLAAPEASEAAGAGLFRPLAAQAAAAAQEDRLAEALLRPAGAVAAPVRPPAPAAQYPSYGRPRRSGYRAPTGPTRDQTSLFGVEVQVTGMSRDVEEFLFGQRFEFDVDSTRLLVKPTLRPASFFELFGLAGIADLRGDEPADFNGDNGFAYGGGARVTFFRNPEWFDTTLFAEGQYLQYESEARGVEFEDPPGSGTIVLAEEEFRWREWEARFGISWRFYYSRPYLGLRYSDVEADDIVRFGGTSTRTPLRATDNIGGFVGIAIYFDPSRRIGLNLEATFPDYTSITGGLRFWF
jgi:hypothetical protein